MQVGRQLAGRLEVVPERLLDDDPLFVRHQVRLGQAVDHRGEQRRRDLQVEHRVVPVAERPRHLRIQLLAVEVAADVGEPCGEPVEHGVVEVLAGLLDRIARAGAQLLVGQVAPRHPEHGNVEQSPSLEPVERAERLLPGQIAGYAEDDKRVCFAIGHALQATDYPALPSSQDGRRRRATWGVLPMPIAVWRLRLSRADQTIRRSNAEVHGAAHVPGRVAHPDLEWRRRDVRDGGGAEPRRRRHLGALVRERGQAHDVLHLRRAHARGRAQDRRA